MLNLDAKSRGGELSRDRMRQGCRIRAYREVFTACPGTTHRSGSPPNFVDKGI
jgi:hypothetical protein